MFGFDLHNHQNTLRYKQLFTSDVGRLVLKDLLVRCGYDQPSFDPDPYKTARNEGRREIALDILGILSEDSDSFLQELLNTEEPS